MPAFCHSTRTCASRILRTAECLALPLRVSRGHERRWLNWQPAADEKAQFGAASEPRPGASIFAASPPHLGGREPQLELVETTRVGRRQRGIIDACVADEPASTTRLTGQTKFARENLELMARGNIGPSNRKTTGDRRLDLDRRRSLL